MGCIHSFIYNWSPFTKQLPFPKGFPEPGRCCLLLSDWSVGKDWPHRSPPPQRPGSANHNTSVLWVLSVLQTPQASCSAVWFDKPADGGVSVCMLSVCVSAHTHTRHYKRSSYWKLLLPCYNISKRGKTLKRNHSMALIKQHGCVCVCPSPLPVNSAIWSASPGPDSVWLRV